MDSFFAQLSESVSRARTLEELTRPLLEMLEAVTGLESTYLTTIDVAEGLQHVVYARNSRDLQIPEGLSVPWGDTLCKRALDEGRPFTDDVAGIWGDSGAARDLGIQTYVSTPVRTDDGGLYGTLCAASSQRRPLSDTAEHALRLFARLIEQHVTRERLVEKLQHVNAELLTQALTDPLTGLPNRRALMQELARLKSLAQRTGSWLLAGAIDLDGFKQVNDSHGHDAGDEFLCGIAARLNTALRGGDVLARMGGDEFVVIGLGPTLGADGMAAARLLQDRLAAATVGRYAAAAVSIDYAGASVGVACLDPHQCSAEQVLRDSDAAMYRVKLLRRQQG
ncbi:MULTISPECIES: sensor domain-containing diguanylate cyclase [unclassified Roseateles]|uniref:sensor domain-containing diguanylate cyclase n=1 Tax=unclassified Roseateles TaxID=2626991 RepID=UPI0006F86CB8|nr:MULTISPECIES: sensor domain-containing diguanylate cyclase [unclassified Roseateles]KQW51541.1 diguanylate cyclase [Pelomonas sp. Root405]KRA77774.1 diguanylate cyclase [Pelomonas sp. Root662]